MSFRDLHSFMAYLERRGELVRIRAEVDPDQEITIIQHRVLAQEGPALLFERVKGSAYPLVSNLFGTLERVEAVFGGSPRALGDRMLHLADELMPPSPRALFRNRRELYSIFRARLRSVKKGPIMETVTEPPRLDKLPVLTCWPDDGGPFFTLPLIHTQDPVTGKGNLGIYRLQRFTPDSTGMHWQIEKGGGFHFHQAKELGQELPISVFLGGPPALTIAAVAPLPEGIDERLLCAMIMGSPLDVILRPSGHRIPAWAEFVLEGTVAPDDTQKEGPFGDHFGHYSHSAHFPVFRVNRVLARRDAVYPATVVGKPVQEDFHIGVALQDMAGPLMKLTRPAIQAVWAYPETGFHPLAVASVAQRYPREALKHAMGLLGEGQLSLTKIMVIVDHTVDVRRIEAVSHAVWDHLETREGFHLISPTAQDTLDFTGPAMNSGSRLVLIATRGNGAPVRMTQPPAPPSPAEIHPDVIAIRNIGPAFLIVQVTRDAKKSDIMEHLAHHEVTRRYLFHTLVSDDVEMDNVTSILWGWFTRFDPLLDLHPANREVLGNKLIFDFPIAIDATWKQGYPKPVAFDPDIAKRVDRRWKEFGIPVA